MTPRSKRYAAAYTALFLIGAFTGVVAGLLLQTHLWPWPLWLLFQIGVGVAVGAVLAGPSYRWIQRAPQPVVPRREWTEDEL